MPAVTGGGEVTTHGTERLLIDAAERALRAPRGKLALVLRISVLKPPAPRPHHLRIAMALLQDTAQRYAGQIFPLGNADLVLLCAAPDEDNRLVSGQASPLGLPGALGRLFAADTADAGNLTTIWRLEDQAASFRAYLAQRSADPAVAPSAPADDALAATSVAGLAALEALLATVQIPNLLAQQTAIELRPGRGQPLTARLAPLFRELTFSFATLAENRDIADACTDPFLFRHYAARLDERMLQLLQADLQAGGRLTRPTLRQGLPLHLNLTLESIISPAFARLSQTARQNGARFGIEISLMEAVSDMKLLEYARSLLDLAGFPLVLDGLDETSLVLVHAAVLRPDLIKLTWSPRLADAPPLAKEAIDAAIARLTARTHHPGARGDRGCAGLGPVPPDHAIPRFLPRRGARRWPHRGLSQRPRLHIAPVHGPRRHSERVHPRRLRQPGPVGHNARSAAHCRRSVDRRRRCSQARLIPPPLCATCCAARRSPARSAARCCCIWINCRLGLPSRTISGLPAPP